MKVLGYARVSNDKQTSIPEQKKDIRDFVNTTDDYEFGEEHELVEPIEYDHGKSGSKRAVDRDGFGNIIDRLKEDSSIDGIVVFKFDRFSRDPVDWIASPSTIRRYIVGRPIEILQLETWQTPYRAIPPMTAEGWKRSDNPVEAMNRAMMFALMAFQAASFPMQASVNTGRTMRHMKNSNRPVGRQPRGITTDKQHEHFESDQSNFRVVDPKEGIAFVGCIEILNELAITDKSPYEVGLSYGRLLPLLQ